MATPEYLEMFLKEEFFRTANGSGGQHLNKSSSAVRLIFDAAGSKLFDDSALARFMKNIPITLSDGSAALVEQGSRSLERNRRVARERLAELVNESLKRPAKRGKTKRTRASVERRLNAKKARSRIKASRSGKLPE